MADETDGIMADECDDVMADGGDNVRANEGDDGAWMLSNSLLVAIHNNDIEQVRICIKRGVDLTLVNVFHSELSSYDKPACPLALACCLCHEDIMEELLKAGADPNQVSGRYDETVMHIAGRGCVITLPMIRSLIFYGADVTLIRHWETILHYLARCEFNGTDGDLLSAAKLLLANGASFNDQNDRFTPLYWACRCGKVDLVKLFIAEGADVNVDTGHVTMLTAAARSSSIDMFDVLLDAGANRNLTPDALIEPCTRNDRAMIARILNTCDVDINMALDEGPGRPILHYACDDRGITTATVQLLLDHGADVKAFSDTGDTVLHYASRYGDCSKIRQLLSYSPPLKIKNNENQTPLITFIHTLYPATWYPTAWYHTRVLAFKMLVTAGANITADVEHELNQLCIKDPETQISEYEICSTRSLNEMCRLVIRGSIPVPVDVSLCKLPIPKLLQEYLNFPEFDQVVDGFLNIHPWKNQHSDKC